MLDARQPPTHQKLETRPSEPATRATLVTPNVFKLAATKAEIGPDGHSAKKGNHLENLPRPLKFWSSHGRILTLSAEIRPMDWICARAARVPCQGCWAVFVCADASALRWLCSRQACPTLDL